MNSLYILTNSEDDEDDALAGSVVIVVAGDAVDVDVDADEGL